MSDLEGRVAKYIAMELMDLTVEQRNTFKFPEDANGDTIDRATSCAERVMAISEIADAQDRIRKLEGDLYNALYDQ